MVVFRQVLERIIGPSHSRVVISLMSERIRGYLGEGVPVEGCDPGADMPNKVSGAIWRPKMARSSLPDLGVRSRLTASEAGAMVQPITVSLRAQGDGAELRSLDAWHRLLINLGGVAWV